MKFSIGIDLGTTNCALAFVQLDEPGSRSRVLPIPQRESAATEAEHSTLPSFLFRPGEGDATWIAGAFARKQAADRPGAVAHSAKSWLCHHAVDRSRPILPWGSDELKTDEKISPIEASALLLMHLKQAWQAAFGGDEDAAFDKQDITVTVPASFDSAAQKLTLEAAATAGFPESIRLLEEPQAAFYRWLEGHPEAGALEGKLPGLASAPQHVLVVDIGGGTSDFSLFEIRTSGAGKAADIKRVAVSDHILLGGDNIDLAIAHLAEPRLGQAGERGTLTGRQWSDLVARCRDLKEHILGSGQGDGDQADESFPISVAAAGSGLLAGTLTAEVTREEIDKLVFEGFFPRCECDAKLQVHYGALKEMGLPYAADSAITKHLAAFLRGRPAVDAILFNGGTLSPAPLREHLVVQVASWQDGVAPIVLDNPERDLAVARGAAHYGALFHRSGAARIAAGAARAVYLEVAGGKSSSKTRSLVCILPRGTQPEQEILLTKPELRLRLGKRVEFQTWYSTRHGRDKAGTTRALEREHFHPLPPLRTTAELSGKEYAPDDCQLRIHLRATLNAVGMLQVACVSAEKSIEQSWPLEFDLGAVHQQGSKDEKTAQPAPAHKPAEPPETEEMDADPGVDAAALTAARERIAELLQNPPDRRDPVTAARLLKSLEKILGQPKQDWNGALVRDLWSVLDKQFEARALSVEHEETWLSCAGFLLRPGYGAPGDAARIDQLWRLHEEGLAFPNKRVRIQAHVLWRRVAGGLDHARQAALIAPEMPRLRESNNPPVDLVLLAGALERLEADTRRELASLFLARGVEVARGGGHAGPFFMALGSLLNRTPLYAGPEAVLPAELVAEVFEALRELDWSAGSAAELPGMFLKAGRLTGDRQLDLPAPLGRQIAAKLTTAGVSPVKLAPLREVIAVAASDRSRIFGESLPPGISLGA
jgi:molecular chaperone DnaK (HSP70)